MRQVSVGQLFKENSTLLGLRHVCGSLDAVISVTEASIWPADLVGHFSLIHPKRLQVIGAAEMAWGRKQPSEKMLAHLHDVLAGKPSALVVADGEDTPALVQAQCEAANIPLFETTASSAQVVDLLRGYLGRTLAEQISVHGVFMDVLGLGVLITGDSGVGKSELALELISRGHGLVADDVVEIARIAPDVLEGRCPDLLKDFLEVRGLGVINIRTIFGETARRRKMKLKLAVHLQKPRPGITEDVRLPLDEQSHEILGVPIRRVILPVAAGRNLAVLLEAAVRTTILLLRGIDTNSEFIDRQRQALETPDQG